MKQGVNDLRKKNNELGKKLTEKNAIIMTDIVVYLRVGNITEAQVESVRQDLLDMVLTAQDRGDDISTIIGEDYQAFCDDILQSATPKTLKERAAEVAYIIIRSIYVLLTINVIFSPATRVIIRNLIDKQPSDFQFPISAGLILGIAIIVAASYLIVIFIGKKSFKLTASAKELKTQPKKQTYPKRFLWGAIFGLTFALFVLTTVKLSSIVLFKVNIFVLAFGIIVMFVIDKLASNRG